MANTQYTAAQAAARAKSYSSWQTAMCLRFVMTCLTPGVRSPYVNDLPDANHAWTHAQAKRYTNNPPAGAPVYWRSGQYGHIALSLGGGLVRSTDWATNVGTRHGSVGTVSISRITSAWGMTYRGWSTDYAGLWIPGLGTVSTAPGTKSVDLTSPIAVKYIHSGLTNTSIARFEKALWNWMGADWRTRNAGLSQYLGDGAWGTVTLNVMLAAYARLGMNTVGVVYPGPTLLHTLGFTSVVA